MNGGRKEKKGFRFWMGKTADSPMPGGEKRRIRTNCGKKKGASTTPWPIPEGNGPSLQPRGKKKLVSVGGGILELLRRGRKGGGIWPAGRRGRKI